MKGEAVEQHCRTIFASWDGYRGVGGVTKQHFTEEQRDWWREYWKINLSNEAKP